LNPGRAVLRLGTHSLDPMAQSQSSEPDSVANGIPEILAPDPLTDLDGVPLPTLVSGTSTEFLGRKPLPRAVQRRPVVFLLGAKGVGKTTVALHLAGVERRYVPEEELVALLPGYARHRSWDEAYLAPAALVLEAPCFLSRRPAVTQALQHLLLERAARGGRSFVCEAEDEDPMRELIGSLSPKDKATVLLRFPVGRGRRRYVLRMCDELGVDRVHARVAVTLERWTYARARKALMEISTRS